MQVVGPPQVAAYAFVTQGLTEIDIIAVSNMIGTESATVCYILLQSKSRIWCPDFVRIRGLCHMAAHCVSRAQLKASLGCESTLRHCCFRASWMTCHSRPRIVSMASTNSAGASVM